jgi:hypothetical protein
MFVTNINHVVIFKEMLCLLREKYSYWLSEQTVVLCFEGFSVDS